MKELLVKLSEEAQELGFAALKFRANPSKENRKKLLDEVADVLAAVQAAELPHNKERILNKVRKYVKLKGNK